VVKNKMAPPFREVEFDITYGEGVSHEGALIDLGVEAKAVDKAGAWLSYKGERIGQGRENAKAFLREHPEIAAAIEAEILAAHGLERKGVKVEAAEAAPVDAVPKPESKKKKNGAARRSRPQARN
jgi:recombination protein RecA